MFHVGQKVECVNDACTNGDKDPPHKGLVYTISEIVLEPTMQKEGLNFKELAPRDTYCCWNPARFRPLDERQTSITIFQEIVRKVKNNEPVEVS